MDSLVETTTGFSRNVFTRHTATWRCTTIRRTETTTNDCTAVSPRHSTIPSFFASHYAIWRGANWNIRLLFCTILLFDYTIILCNKLSHLTTWFDLCISYESYSVRSFLILLSYFGFYYPLFCGFCCLLSVTFLVCKFLVFCSLGHFFQFLYLHSCTIQ